MDYADFYLATSSLCVEQHALAIDRHITIQTMIYHLITILYTDYEL